MKRQTKPVPGVTRPWTEARKELFTPRDLAEIDWEVARELSLSQVRVSDRLSLETKVAFEQGDEEALDRLARGEGGW